MEQENSINNNILIMKGLSQTLENLSKQQESDKEKIFTNIQILLTDLIENSNIFNELVEDDTQKYFINKFLPLVIKVILDESYSAMNDNLAKACLSILNSVLLEFSNAIRDTANEELNTDDKTKNKLSLYYPVWEKIIQVFNEEKFLYRTNIDASDIYLDYIYKKLNPNAEAWRKQLAVGDQIDTIAWEKDKIMYKVGVGSWTRATILEINETNMNCKVSFNGTKDIKVINLNSSHVLPFKTMSTDYEWRENLTLNDEFDFLDIRSWYLSTAVDIKEKTLKGKQLTYGLRVYRDNAKIKDKKTEKFYIGWSDSFDKEVSPFDPRIRKPFTFSKKIHNPDIYGNYPMDSKKFNEVETFIPFVLPTNTSTTESLEGIHLLPIEQDKYIYAVPKKLEQRDVNIILMKIIDFFIEQDSLKNILYAIDNLKSKGDLDSFSLLVDTLYYLNPFLHIKYAESYCQDFVKRSLYFLINFSKSDSSRNFNRVKIEALIKKLKDILSKSFFENDINAWFDVFTIDFGLNAIASKVLDMKLIGLKMLTETLSDISRSTNTSNNLICQIVDNKHLPLKSLLDMISRANPIKLLFKLDTHYEVVNASVELVKTLLINRCLEAEDVLLILTLARKLNDYDTKMYLYKCLKSNTTYFGYDLMIFTIKEIVNLSSEGDFSMNDLELLCNTYNLVPGNTSSEYANLLVCFFFNTIIKHNQLELDLTGRDNTTDESLVTNKYAQSYTTEVYNEIENQFILLLSYWDMKDFKQIYIDKLINIIETNSHIITSNKGSSAPEYDVYELSLILVKSLEKIFLRSEKSLQDDIMNFLIMDKHLDQIVISLLESYYKSAREQKERFIEKLNNLNTESLSIDYSKFIVISLTNIPHDSIVLNFIKIIDFLGREETLFKIDVFINKMFELLYLQYISDDDKNKFFQMLTALNDKNLLETSLLRKIMNNMHSESLNDISLDMYNCIWKMFLIINKDKIYCVESYTKQSEKYQGISNSGQVYEAYSYNPNAEKKEEIKLLGDINELECLDFIWNIILNSNIGYTKNSNKQIVLYDLIRVYTSNDLTAFKKSVIWEILINKCISELEKVNYYKNPSHVIKTILLILSILIEESEINGTAGVLSHNSITKASYLKLNYKIYIRGFNTDLISLNVLSNTTLWDLKSLIAKEVGLIPEAIKLYISGNKDLSERDHGKTLVELKIKDDETIHVTKSTTLDNIPKLPLIINDDLSPRLIEVFGEIFKRFSSSIDDSEPFMYGNNVVDFITIVTETSGQIDVEDSRVKNFLVNYGDGDKLGQEQFINFYSDALIKNKKLIIVWENLYVLGYRNDLKKLNDPLEEYNQTKEYMPRYLISANNDYFDVIFNLQSIDFKDKKINDEINSNINKFLGTISTNTHIYNTLLELKDNYSAILSLNNIHLIYGLGIIEGIIEDLFVNGNNEENKINWFKNFICKGGFESIILLFNESIKEGKKKICLFIIKILKHLIIFNVKVREIEKNTNTSIIILNSIDMFIENEPVVINELTNQEDKSEVIISQASMEFTKKCIADFISSSYGLRASDINCNINYKDLFQNIILICYDMLKNSNDNKQEKDQISLEQDDKSIFLNSLNIVFLMFFSNLITQDELVNNTNLKQILLQVILIGLKLVNKSNIVRDIKFSMISLCMQSKESSFVYLLLQTFLEEIKTLTKYEKGNLKYYFLIIEICCNIINSEILNLSRESTMYINTINSLNSSIDTIISNIINKQEKNDDILYGYFRLVKQGLNINKKLLNSKNVKELISTLVDTYLIRSIDPDLEHKAQLSLIENDIISMSEDENSDICVKNSDSRRAIFDLIIQIITANEELALQCLFETKFSNICNYTSSNITKKSYHPYSERRNLNFAGIKNPSSVCYINSILQQIFNVPTFRYSIISANDYKPENITSDQAISIYDNTPIDDNILHQLQKLFSYLDLTQRQEAYPHDFCYSFKDWDGNPTNMKSQQDSQEFLSRFFDNIDNLLKPTIYKNLVKDIFTGSTCSQLYCTGGCGTVKSNFEDFPFLSVEIKNLKTLKESFNSLISEEKIDYECEVCKKKVDLVKQISLASLPNVLFVHLKRFNYNYNTLRIDKLNSRLEFPMTINLKEYSTEHIINENDFRKHNDEFNKKVYKKQEDYYEYQLVGVNVHLGTADAGHYKSIIYSSRYGKDDSMEGISKDFAKWLMFNDSSISTYDIKKLEEDCFGGATTENNNENWYKSGKENSQSAYMLVYERIIKTPLTIIEPIESCENPIIVNSQDIRQTIRQYNPLECESTAYSRDNKVFYNEESKEYFVLKDFYSYEKKINSKYYSQIVIDNIKFVNDQKIYNSLFSIFYEKLLSKILNYILVNQDKCLLHGIDVMFSIYYDILIKSNYKDNFVSITGLYCDFFSKTKGNVLLSKISFNLLDKLLSNKEVLFELLFSSDEKLGLGIKNLLFVLITSNYCKNSSTQEALEYLISLIPVEASKSWNKMSIYLDLIKELTQIDNEVIIDFLFENQLIFKLVDFFLNKESPYNTFKDGRYEIGSKAVMAPFFSLIVALSNLTRKAYPIVYYSESCDIIDLPFTQQYTGEYNKIYSLSQKEIEALEQKQLYIKAFNYASPSLSFMMAHCMFNNFSFSKKKLFGLVEFLNDTYNFDKIKLGFEALVHILSLNDKYSDVRLEWVLGLPEVNIKYDNNQPKLIDYMGKYNYSYDKFIKYTSTLLYDTEYEPLLSRMYGKYQSSSDYILILNYFFVILLNNEKTLDFFFMCPSPLTPEETLKDHIYYMAEIEIKRINNISSIKEKHGKNVDQYYLSKSKIDKLYQEKGHIKSNLIMKYNHQLSQIISKEVITDLTENYPELLLNNTKLLQFKYEITEYLPGEEKNKETNTNVTNGINNKLKIKIEAQEELKENLRAEKYNQYKAYDSDDSSSDLHEQQANTLNKKESNNSYKMYGPYLNLNSNNEETFIKRILQDMKSNNTNQVIREFKETSNEKSAFLITSFLFFNEGTKEVKIKTSFKENNTGIQKTYIPETVIISNIKLGIPKHVYSFYSSIFDDIELIVPEIELKSDIKEKTNGLNKANSTDILALPAANDEYNGPYNNNFEAEADTFDMICPSCGFSNIINSFSNYECSKCKSSLFA